MPDLTIFGEDGALLPEVIKIIDLCKQYNMVLATGHLPIASGLVLAEEAEARGVQLVLTHPLSGSVGATIDQQKTVVQHGGMIEHVFVGAMPMHQRMHPQKIVDAIAAIGVEHCIMASDAIEGWNPPEPELMRMFIGSMLALGVSESDVHQMTHENPVRLFRLDEDMPEPVSVEEPVVGVSA